MKKFLPIAALLAAVIATGCTEATVEVSGEIRSLPPGASIALSASDALASNATVRCISKVIGQMDPPLHVVPAKRFREAVFAGEPPETDDTALAERLMRLKDHPRYGERLAALGLRYMVLVDRPRTDTEFGNFDCDGGGGGFVCAAVWDRNSTIRARVIDLDEGADISGAAAHVSGKRVLLLPLPLYIPSATEGEACTRLAEAIVQRLTGGKARVLSG